MADTILQSFLNAQLIRTSDDGNIASLKKAIGQVKMKLETKRAEVIPYTLVAFDPKVDERDPVIIEVEKVIIKGWPAFKNSVSVTKDKATTYIRAVILESLSQMTKKDAELTALVWYSIRDVYAFYDVGEKEFEIAKPFLQSLADKTEQTGRGSWQTHNELELDVFEPSKIGFKESQKIEVSEENLKTQFLDGFVHVGWKSHAGGGENPHTQAQNNWHWPKFAAERTAEGLTKEINSVLLRQNDSISGFLKAINEGVANSINQLKPFLQKLSQELMHKQSASDRRSQLLWWKQSLYSKRLNASYRNQQSLENTIVATLDLTDIVDPIYPESVDYLLRETLRDIHGETMNEKLDLSEILDQIIKVDRFFEDLLAPFVDEKDGRKLQLIELANTLKSKSHDVFFEKTGIASNAQLSLSDFAVWLFHNLQGLKLIAKK